MSDRHASPDWTLLPHRPEEFFNLDENFDRKDLKRSYNLLLRQFKPEKFPAEFQRIRAAFEYLDNQLRYGRTLAADQGMVSYKWHTDIGGRNGQESAELAANAADSKREAATEQPARALPLHKRIQKEPLVEVYRQLAAKSDRSPYDYYALAIMSDVVDRKDELQFARWILVGLQKHPGDPGLASLLYEYYRGPVPKTNLTSLLMATSKIVANDRFFSLTESLWKRLLREVPFGTFKDTLDACKNNLRDLGIDARLVFFVEILKPAMWKADLAWIEAAMSFIEENFERIPYHLQYEVDVLSILRKYAQQRPQFLQGHPLRQQIDRAICDYYSQEQSAGDRSVLDCEVRVAQDPAGILSALPFENGEDHENLYLIWLTITQDVWERHFDPDVEKEDVSMWQSRADAVLRRIQDVTRTSTIGQAWTLVGFGYLGGIVAFYLVIIIAVCFLATLLTVSAGTVVAMTLNVGTVCAGVALAFWLHRRFLTPMFLSYNHKKQLQCYSKLWRSEFAEFMHRSQLDFFEFRDLLCQCDISQLPTANGAIAFYQQDYALTMFSGAQKFVS
jgi:hypothetical protein